MKKSQHSIKAELSDLGLDLEHNPSMPQRVPNDYFDNFKTDMLEHIDALAFVSDLPKNMPQQVPADYWQSSKVEMLENIKAIDFLETLPKKMPQSLPDGYFEQSKQKLLNEITAAEPAAPITVPRRRKRQNWALAATMALLVSMGLFFMNTLEPSTSIEDSLSQIPAEMIDAYMQENSHDFEAYEILENPQSSTTKLQELEEQILNETKTMSDEEIFVYVL